MPQGCSKLLEINVIKSAAWWSMLNSGQGKTMDIFPFELELMND